MCDAEEAKALLVRVRDAWAGPGSPYETTTGTWRTGQKNEQEQEQAVGAYRR